MRRLLLLFLIPLSLFAVESYADQNVASESPVTGYGYSFGGDDESTGAYLGIDIADVTPERLSTLKLKDEHGVEVTIVDQDAPAGKAGIREHDVILTMNGVTVESGAQLRRMIRETPPGRVVTLGISRDGQPLTIKVQLADRRKSGSKWSSNKDIHIEMPPMPPMPDFDVPVSVVVVHSSMRSGLAVENITPQLGEFFGVKGGKGVLVRSVEKGSRAERAGFRAGDVIVKVNDQAVNDTSDFSHAIRLKTNGPVGVVIIRDKREQTLPLPLPERRDSGELFQETYDWPDVEIDAEGTVDLSQVQNEMARMMPQMQLALDETHRNMEAMRSQIEEARRVAAEQYRAEAERSRQEARAATEQAREFCRQQREMERQKRHLQEQLKHQHEELQKQNRKQMERLRHEMQGDWLSI